MKIDILTIFPKMFEPILNESILKRARQKNLITIRVHNLRDWTTDKHKITDDRPFGGGPGMVMKPEPIFRAVDSLQATSYKLKAKTILLTPKGQTFTQQIAKRLSKLEHIILICGRYEGVDQRVHDYLADQRISIGNYVLTGGELPAMVVTDAVTRLVPCVLGNPDSLKNESFTAKAQSATFLPTTGNNQSNSVIHQFDYPQYTHPRSFKYQGRELTVPEILLTGDHKQIAEWRSSRAKLLSPSTQHSL
jgi:tRNA (guanine37-N1)-methyltransferase